MDIAVHGVSVVVPVCNSSGSISQLVERLQAVLGGVVPQYEIILVDDGSSDDSWSKVEELSGSIDCLRGIRLSRNYGQHNALLCGIRECRMPVTVTIDDDLQTPPEEIPKLLEALDGDIDVVYGTPRRERHGVLRRLASRFTKLVLSSAMGAKTASRVSAFRAFRTELRCAFDGYRGAFVSIDVLLSWATVRFDSVTVRHEPRKFGHSQYTVRRLVIHALNMMTGFSTLPLEIASLAGFFFTLFGLGVLVFVLARYFFVGGRVPGFPFLASIIAIFSGAQLLVLGITGEYLSRMYFRTMGRPGSIVRSTTNSGDTILNS